MAAAPGRTGGLGARSRVSTSRHRAAARPEPGVPATLQPEGMVPPGLRGLGLWGHRQQPWSQQRTAARKDGCCPRGCQGSWSSMEGALAAGQLAEVSSCRTSLFLSRSPLRHRGSDHRGSGGTRSSQRTAVRTGPDCGRRASPAAAAGMAWRGQDAGGRQRTGRPSPGEGFASETLIRNSCLLFNKHRTTGVKTYSLTSYEKPLSPTCAT